jgi:hypothetical protein
MFQNSFLNTNPKHIQAWEDNAYSVHEGETGFSIVRGEEWTFICPIDFVHYQFNSGRDNLDLLFLIASLSGCEERVFSIGRTY